MNGSVAACFNGCGVVARTDLTRAFGAIPLHSFSMVTRVDLPVFVRPENINAGSMSCCLYFSRLLQYGVPTNKARYPTMDVMETLSSYNPLSDLAN